MNDQMRKHINTVENKEEINNFVNQIIVDTFLKAMLKNKGLFNFLYII